MANVMGLSWAEKKKIQTVQQIALHCSSLFTAFMRKWKKSRM